MSTKKPFESHRHRILRVQLYIEEHLDGDLSLENLAEVAQLSSYHFHRVFRANVGESLAEYVRRIRLEAAAIALKFTNTSVTNIAFDAGYGSHEAFTRAFRRRFGVSPSDQRNMHQPPERSETNSMNSDSATREVRIEAIPPFNVAFLRHTGPYDSVGPTFGKLGAWAGKQGFTGPNTKVLSICHDDPDVTPPEKLRTDCCISVDESVEPAGDIQIKTLTPGECVVLTHRGPYTNLKDSWCWLYGEWLSTSGREFANQPPMEIYLNSPENTAPEDLITEVCIPLKS